MGAEIQVEPLGLGEDATDRDIMVAWNTAVQNAQFNHGNSGYTGTIAEAVGHEVRRDLKFNSIQEAEDEIDSYAEKWGPSIAILVRRRKGDDFEFAFAGIYSS